MSEKPANTMDKPARKKIDKYDILGLLVGLILMGVGIAGILTSITATEDYSNSTDIRTVDAVIERIESSKKVIG